MTLPREVRNHHTIWVDVPGGRTSAIRYAMDDDRLVCFGDDGLSKVANGQRMTAGVWGIASGPPDANFWVTVKELTPDQVTLATLADVVGGMPLGRNADEVLATLETMRLTRRVVTLEG